MKTLKRQLVFLVVLASPQGARAQSLALPETRGTKPFGITATHSFETGKGTDGKLQLGALHSVQIPQTIHVSRGSSRNAKAALSFLGTSGKETKCTYAGPSGKYLVRIRFILGKALGAAAGINGWRDVLLNPDASFTLQSCKGSDAKNETIFATQLTLQLSANEPHFFYQKTLEAAATISAAPLGNSSQTPKTDSKTGLLLPPMEAPARKK